MNKQNTMKKIKQLQAKQIELTNALLNMISLLMNKLSK